MKDATLPSRYKGSWRYTEECPWGHCSPSPNVEVLHRPGDELHHCPTWCSNWFNHSLHCINNTYSLLHQVKGMGCSDHDDAPYANWNWTTNHSRDCKINILRLLLEPAMPKLSLNPSGFCNSLESYFLPNLSTPSSHVNESISLHVPSALATLNSDGFVHWL